ncbi:helix-turn-helix domain-containing protein [Flavobacterium sp.]|uniref:winged helix-turn-helix transcriptional regulator n=1 Tax=Flavobacterium sp. TaxID=239 RepID=UPI00121FBE62|nr:helix-turn-helix domain-containing protein [Flavobacterium sp.]RZJ69308.1 MAG: transcriptional regulator [Flavobacterium sp.]
MTIDCKNEQYVIDGKQFPCSTSITMEFIGGKYKTVILFHLRNGALRYNELRKFMPVVTERTLSLQLKQLEEDGLLKRTVYTQKPPLKVEYELTDFGKTLIPMLEIIAKWGRDVASEKAKVVPVRI